MRFRGGGCLFKTDIFYLSGEGVLFFFLSLFRIKPCCSSLLARDRAAQGLLMVVIVEQFIHVCVWLTL